MYMGLYHHFHFLRQMSVPSQSNYQANICLFKVNNRNTRKRYEICSKLTIKTPERRQKRRSDVSVVNFKHL